MKEKCYGLLALCIWASFGAMAQTTVISGYVKDSISGEALVGATVSVPKLRIATATNNYGYFSLSVPAQKNIAVVVSYVSHSLTSFSLDGQSSKTVSLLLPPLVRQMSEVIIGPGKKNDNVQRTRMSTIDLPVKMIKTIPLIAGERDVLKVVQFLPGVQSGNEGTTGFYVRGGNIDQNLVQLDEATVYNPNHLFGLFSTFNVNALKNVNLIKGGFPAQYGGRLSSILDITMKDGNKYKFKGEGGIGLLSANLTLEGPIQKGKSSFIVSARRSYIDLVTRPFIPKNKNNTTYYLYDINAKMNFNLGRKDQLFLSFFKGNDRAAYTGASSLNYSIAFGNSAATLRWNHLFGNKLFLNTAIINNHYHLSLATSQNNYYALLYSAIRDWTVKSTLEWHPDSKQTVLSGVQFTRHAIAPSSYSAKIPRRGNQYAIKPDSVRIFNSNEMALFVNDEYVLSPVIGINAGVRMPIFSASSVVYTTLEPRLTLKFSTGPSSSIKIAYTDMTQFLHLVPNSTASLPTDIWLSSSKLVKPQKSRQVAAGFFENFADNTYEASIEVYHKMMNNQVLFKEGTQILAETDIEQQLCFGKGKSYGIELFVRKNAGRLTGWVSYTLSKTTQQFDSVNYGKEFPFTYDRRHVLNVVASFQFSEHWNFAANFVFNTGSAFTLPSGRAPVFMGGTLYDQNYYDYTNRNNYRLRTYHRLDLSASYRKTRKIFGRHYESEWSFSLYNAYSRLNAYFVYLTTDIVNKSPQARQVSLLPVVPGVSFNFSF